VTARRVVNTAFSVAALRVLEQDVAPARRLFDDALVGRLLTGPPAVVLRSRRLRRAFAWLVERGAPGFYGGVVCRTRAIDDACRETLALGAKQVVLLGAGLDTRPYRMPEMRVVDVWEVDLPAVQARKRRAIQRALGAPPPNVRFVALDFERTRVLGALSAEGFDARAPALVVWEAVSQYLERSAVDDILDFAGRLAPRSRLVFTYVPQPALEDARHAKLVRRLHFKSSFVQSELRERLHARGLGLVCDLGPDDYAARWLVPAGRRLSVFDLERVAVAEADAKRTDG
jgi:methyltransferase (TIGR00027 family)